MWLPLRIVYYIRMQSRKLSLGLIVSFLLVVCQPQVNAQFRRGSFSAAQTDAREREVDLGPIEFSRGITRSGAVTANRGGLTRTNSVAVNRGVNIAGFDVDSTFKRTNQRRNGQVTQGVGYELDAGPLGFEASLDPQNFRRPLGLQRDRDGGVDLNLGFLNLDFDLNNQRRNNDDVKTAAQVNARGRNTFTRSGTNANENTRRVGPFEVTDSRSTSNGIAYARRGQTAANTFGSIDGNSQSQALTRGFGFRRGRREAVQTAKKPAVSSKLFLNNNNKLYGAENKTGNLEATSEPQERTFSYLANLFGGLLGGPTPNCVYPCTLEAFQRNSCCPPEYLPIPVPLDTQHCHNCGTRSQYLPQLGSSHIQNPYITQFSNSYFGNGFYQQSQQCCTVCLQYSYNGPLPCAWRNLQYRPNLFLNNF